MSTEGCLFTFYTLTPLHAGAGDSAAAIDLPVQRERHTEYPVVYSSGIKGSLRYFFECNDTLKSHVNEIFGKENDESGGSGKVIFTDAKILLFPVRSSEGVFKLVTSPFVLNRLQQDLALLDIPPQKIGLNLSVCKGLTFDSNYNEKRILLEDFPIELKTDTTAPELLKKLTVNHFFEEDILKSRLIIVSDDVFKTLVTTATQIIARNVLDNDTKKSDNLWYEEVVPPDALFYTIMKPAFKGNTAITNLESGINGQVLQIGGNETIGYGLVRMSANRAGELRKKGG
ncbi:MAG: type III-B CRISPR module RAMP protein Cmr4 [Candidatus Brocadia sp.]|nr:type III-B CRISPR module RAMP protein Cmr4 [Candidatus Brocadia sp.]